MHPAIRKTFGGLAPSYYFRNFFFGLLIAAFLLFILRQEHGLSIGSTVWIAVNVFLYPYARFVYESIMDFILGDNFFLVGGGLLLFGKLLTMVLCWCLALFLTPIGFLYLYHHHSKAEAEASFFVDEE